MKVKPNETVRIFTVEQRWSIDYEELEKIICEHLGISYDSSTYIVNDGGYGNVEVKRIEINRQYE